MNPVNQSQELTNHRHALRPTYGPQPKQYSQYCAQINLYNYFVNTVVPTLFKKNTESFDYSNKKSKTYGTSEISPIC